jgi:hypothetical protein
MRLSGRKQSIILYIIFLSARGHTGVWGAVYVTLGTVRHGGGTQEGR